MSIDVNNESDFEVNELEISSQAQFVLRSLHINPAAELSVLLVDEIAMATSADAFLSKVLCRVQESDTGSWRDFSLGVGGVIQYQRSEDLMPRVCVPHVCRAAVLHTAHVIVCWRAILGWSVRLQVLLVRTGGQVCIVM